MELNFKIQNSSDLGDYLVSTVDIDEAEEMLIENPIFTAPKELMEDDGNCCLTCLKMMKKSFLKWTNRCPQCKWPICSPKCARDDVHKAECKLFVQNRVEYTIPRNLYLKVVRILLAKESPEFANFMHLSPDLDRCKSPLPKLVKAEALECYDFIKNVCKMNVTYSDVFNILSRFRINRFIIESEDSSGNRYEGFALFKVTCKLSHSCGPNLEWAIQMNANYVDARRWEIHLHTRSKIRKGEMTSIRYSSIATHMDTCRRRKIYSKIFPFHCLCSRCKDTTEQGTFFGSPVCQVCSKGYMLAEDPLNEKTMWRCNRCLHGLPAEVVFEEVSVLEKEISYLVSKQPTAVTMQFIDQFIERNAGKTLHVNHFVMFRAYIYWLFQGNFTPVLLKNRIESRDLFRKISVRAQQVRTISSRFLPTVTLVDLDLFLAQKTAEFIFKSSNHRYVVSIPTGTNVVNDAERVLSHITKSLKWAKMGPRTTELDNGRDNLSFLHHVWTKNVKELSNRSKNNVYKYYEPATENFEPAVIEDVVHPMRMSIIQITMAITLLVLVIKFFLFSS